MVTRRVRRDAGAGAGALSVAGSFVESRDSSYEIDRERECFEM